MVLTLITKLRSLAVIACLAIALGVAGFGHRAPSQQDAGVQVFLALGFSTSDLCRTSGDQPSSLMDHCPACTLAGAALMPAKFCLVRDADLRVVGVVLGTRAHQTVAAVYDPARAPRAPPLA
jgi:hypothetical protein